MRWRAWREAGSARSPPAWRWPWSSRQWPPTGPRRLVPLRPTRATRIWSRWASRSIASTAHPVTASSSRASPAGSDRFRRADCRRPRTTPTATPGTIPTACCSRSPNSAARRSHPPVQEQHARVRADVVGSRDLGRARLHQEPLAGRDPRAAGGDHAGEPLAELTRDLAAASPAAAAAAARPPIGQPGSSQAPVSRDCRAAPGAP